MSPDKNLLVGTQGAGLYGALRTHKCVFQPQEQVQREVKGWFPARVWGFLSMWQLPGDPLWTHNYVLTQPVSELERPFDTGEKNHLMNNRERVTYNYIFVNVLIKFLSKLHVLAIADSAAMNMQVHVSFFFFLAFCHFLGCSHGMWRFQG